MIASELIDLLRKHPKACKILGIAILNGTSYGSDDFAVYVESGKFAFGGQSLEEPLRTFRRWLVGACVEWCDANGIVIQQCPLSGGWDSSGFLGEYRYTSRLAAMLGHMEEQP